MRVNILKLAQSLHNLLHAFFDNGAHGLGVIEYRLLFQIANGIAWRQNGFAVKGFFHPSHNAQQGAFTSAIEADDTNLGPIEIRQADVAQHLFARWVGLADTNHGINDFGIHVCLTSPSDRPGAPGR